jgi:hypothetical protein
MPKLAVTGREGKVASNLLIKGRVGEKVFEEDVCAWNDVSLLLHGKRIPSFFTHYGSCSTYRTSDGCLSKKKT